MKATKAYMASLGTTGLLLASSLSLLALVGAIVAFNGWPTGGVADDIRRLVVGDEEASSLTPGAVSETVDSASLTAGTVVSDEPLGPDVEAVVADFVPPSSLTPSTEGTTPGGVLPPGGTIPGGGTPVAGPPGAGTPGDGGTGGGTGPVQVGLPNIPGVTPSNGTLLSTGPLKHTLADTANGTTDLVGGAVGGLNAPLGGTVTDAGKALSELVRSLPDVQVGSNPK